MFSIQRLISNDNFFIKNCRDKSLYKWIIIFHGHPANDHVHCTDSSGAQHNHTNDVSAPTLSPYLYTNKLKADSGREMPQYLFHVYQFQQSKYGLTWLDTEINIYHLRLKNCKDLFFFLPLWRLCSSVTFAWRNKIRYLTNMWSSSDATNISEHSINLNKKRLKVN